MHEIGGCGGVNLTGGLPAAGLVTTKQAPLKQQPSQEQPMPVGSDLDGTNSDKHLHFVGRVTALDRFGAKTASSVCTYWEWLGDRSTDRFATRAIVHLLEARDRCGSFSERVLQCTEVREKSSRTIEQRNGLSFSPAARRSVERGQ